MSHYIIIGAGAAGIEAARELRRLDCLAEITMVSIETEIGSRCMLHKCLGGERTRESLRFIDEDFFEKYQVNWIAGKAVESIKEFAKIIVLDDGREIGYDKLLIATGADYYIPPIPNLRDGENVFGFRSIADMDKIKEAVSVYGERTVIIGAGLVGMDVASALCDMGKNVTVIEMADRIMPLQMDQYTSNVYKKLFEDHGCTFLTGTRVQETVINPRTNRITEVILSGGTSIECDFVVAAASVKPKVDFLQGTSIHAVHMNYFINTVLNKYLKRTKFSVNKGMEVDDYMGTTACDIYAAGDVTGKSSIWPDARIMGKYAARNMTGQSEPCTGLFPDKNTSNFWGVTAVSLGKLEVKEDVHKILLHSDGQNYRKIILRDEYITGALFMGNLSNAGVYLHVIQNEIPIGHLLHKIFRLSFADFYGIDTADGQYRYIIRN